MDVQDIQDEKIIKELICQNFGVRVKSSLSRLAAGFEVILL